MTKREPRRKRKGLTNQHGIADKKASVAFEALVDPEVSFTDLAKQHGVSQQSVSNWCRQVIDNLEKFFEVHLTDDDITTTKKAAVVKELLTMECLPDELSQEFGVSSRYSNLAKLRSRKY